MKGVVQIGEVIDEYMEKLIGKERIRMAAAWPGIAGSQLYGVTEFWKVEDLLSQSGHQGYLDG